MLHNHYWPLSGSLSLKPSESNHLRVLIKETNIRGAESLYSFFMWLGLDDVRCLPCNRTVTWFNCCGWAFRPFREAIQSTILHCQWNRFFWVCWMKYIDPRVCYVKGLILRWRLIKGKIFCKVWTNVHWPFTAEDSSILCPLIKIPSSRVHGWWNAHPSKFYYIDTVSCTTI